MLDIKWILNNPIEADKAFKKRGLKPLSTKLIKMSKSRSEVFVKLEKSPNCSFPTSLISSIIIGREFSK